MDDQTSGESKKSPASISVVKMYGPAAPTHPPTVVAGDLVDAGDNDDDDDELVDAGNSSDRDNIEPRQESSRVSETHVSSSQTIHHNTNSHNKRNASMYITNLPKVINTVSVSVSDQNGKKLNLSLANILAEKQKREQNLHEAQSAHKSDSIDPASFEPFFLDVVPKIPQINDHDDANNKGNHKSNHNDRKSNYNQQHNRNSTSPRRR